MRWKALFYDSDNASDRKKNLPENTKNCFTMKSRKCTPQKMSTMLRYYKRS